MCVLLSDVVGVRVVSFAMIPLCSMRCIRLVAPNLTEVLLASVIAASAGSGSTGAFVPIVVVPSKKP